MSNYYFYPNKVCHGFWETEFGARFVSARKSRITNYVSRYVNYVGQGGNGLFKCLAQSCGSENTFLKL